MVTDGTIRLITVAIVMGGNSWVAPKVDGWYRSGDQLLPNAHSMKIGNPRGSPIPLLGTTQKRLEHPRAWIPVYSCGVGTCRLVDLVVFSSICVSLLEFITLSVGWPVKTGLSSLSRWGGLHREFQQCLTGGHSLPLTKLVSLLKFSWGWSNRVASLVQVEIPDRLASLSGIPYIPVWVFDLDAGQLLLQPRCLFIYGLRITNKYLEKADVVAMVDAVGDAGP